MPTYFDFPLFAAAFGRNRENPSLRSGFFVVAGGGGSSKSGVSNSICICHVVARGGDHAVQTKLKQDTGKDLISQVDVSPAGDLVACSVSNTCQLYRLASRGYTLQPLTSFQTDFAEDVPMQNVARFCRDGKAIVTGGEDGVVRVWELTSHGGRTGATMRVACSGHGSPVSDLACHADGQLAVSVSKDCSARVWRLRDGKSMAELPLADAGAQPSKLAGRACRFSPAHPDLLYTLQSGPRGPAVMTAWRMERRKGRPAGAAWEPLRSFEIGAKPVSALSLSHDGKLLGVGEATGDVSLWRAPLPIGEGELSAPARIAQRREVHDLPVTGASFLPESYDPARRGEAADKGASDTAPRTLVTVSADFTLHTMPAAASGLDRRLLVAALVLLLLVAAFLLLSSRGEAL